MLLYRDGLARREVPAAFDAGARAYDRLTAANPGYHRQLRLSAARLRLPRDGDGLDLLDVGCGTGSSTAALVTRYPRARVTAADASAEMLAVAGGKPWPPAVGFEHASLDELAERAAGPFDGILAAYLVRNLDDVDAGLARLRGLLRPGGVLAVHEFSLDSSARARRTWNAVCAGIIIPAGWVATGDTTLYRHLHRSVTGFDHAARFAARLHAAGFTGVTTEGMVGWQRGIVHTFTARVPVASPELAGGGP